MLGKALYRRNRKKAEKVIPGSQTFSSNGTFVVPYETALYSITINAGSRASGDGGNGADGVAGWESGETASLQPGNGGGGGVAISMWTGQTGISYGESGSRGSQSNKNGSITISWVAP